jgi:superkiller protein 3
MKKPGDAASNFQKAIDLNGDKFMYFYGLAQAYSATRNHRKVVETLTDAEQLLPEANRYHFYSTRGMALAAMKSWSDAIEDLEKAVAIKKTTPLLSQIGKAYFQLRHYDKASAAFKQSLQINPNDADSQKFLAESLMNLGASERNTARKKTQYAEALAAAEKYREKKANNFDAVNLVGRAALGARSYDKALTAFNQALQIKPDYCFAMVNRSKCYIAKEEWGQAESSLNEAASCQPDMALIHDSLGFVLRKQEKLEESLKAYEKAYSIKPTATVKKSIDEVKHNIEVRDFNLAAAEEEAKSAAEIAAERQRLEEERRKREEWERKTDDG